MRYRSRANGERMPVWLIVLLVWVAGVPALVLLVALLALGYEQLRPARLSKPREALREIVLPLTVPLDCASRLHRPLRSARSQHRRSH